MSFYKGDRTKFAFLLPCREDELISASCVLSQDGQRVCELTSYDIVEDTITFELDAVNSNKFKAYDRDLNEREVEFQFQYAWQPISQNETYTGAYSIDKTVCKKKL